MKAVFTEVGRRKLCKAHAGDIMLPQIKQMALGDGGLNESGKPKTVTGNEISLYHELLRRDINNHAYGNEEETSCHYYLRIEKDELVEEIISEIGLYDAEGDLIAYKTCLGLGKDEDLAFTFDMEEIFLNI